MSPPLSSPAPRGPSLEEVRARYLAEGQAALRRPATVAGVALMMLALGVAPAHPTGRALLGVPLAASATWAGLYVALTGVVLWRYRRGGARGRLYWALSGLETAAWQLGVIVLAGASGTLASPWLVLAALGLVANAAVSGLSDRGSTAVALAAPVTALLAYAPHGAGAAATALVVVGFATAGFFVVAPTVERFLREQAQREALQARVFALERQLEREHLARDLHDSVGAALAVTGIYGDLIAQHAGDPEALRRHAHTLREAAHGGLAELRAILEAVAPAAATVEGLAAALRGVLARLPDSIATTLAVTAPAALAVDGRQRLALVRIAQEAITNALRHGGATRLELALDAPAGQLALTVRDDGAGFDPAAPRAGRGLAGAEARARELGGTVAITSQPGAGACVRVDLPHPPPPPVAG